MPTVLKTVDRWSTTLDADTVTVFFKDGTSTLISKREFDRRTREGDTFRVEVEEPKASELPPHVQRMVDEFAELNQRIEKLVAFLETPLFASQPEYDRVLMYTQLGQMQGYAGVLALRLNRAGA